MDDVAQSRTASVLTVALGTWLVLSPIWISLTGGALVSLFITGGVMIFFGLVQLFTDNSLPSWIIGLAAIWLFISAFGFTGVSSTVSWNEAIAAVVAFLLSIWDGVEISHVHDRRHHIGAS